MTELKSSLALISSGQFPPISDDILDEIEDFLVYGLDSELSLAMPNIIYFFQSNLRTYLSTPNLSPASQHYQKRLLRAMRFIRASALTSDLSSQLEELSFIYLNTTNPSFGNSQQLAFVFLVDHFMTFPKSLNGDLDRSSELISWAIAKIESALQVFPIPNPNLYLTVIYSFPLLETIANQSINFNTFINNLLKISKIGLHYLKETNMPSDDLSTILSKLLKLASRLIIKFKHITPDILPLVYELDDLLSSDEIVFSQIIQNYYLVVCSLIQIIPNFRDPKYMKLVEKTIKFLIRNFPYFIQMPFLQTKKIQIYVETVSIFFSRIMPKSLPNLISTLPQAWNMLSCCHGHLLQVTATGQLISQIISPELLANNPYIHQSFLENLISSLELLRIDLDSMDLSKPQSKQFDVDIWMTNHSQIMTLIRCSFQDVPPPNQEQKNKFYYSPLRVCLLIRYVKYICYLLELCGSFGHQQESENSLSFLIQQQMHSTESRKRMLTIFQLFISTMMLLEQPLFRYVINNTMFDLLPKQHHGLFHKFVFSQFLKSPYSFDFLAAFFNTLATRFNEVMYPTPPNVLLLIIKTLFSESFSNASPLTIDQTTLLSRYVYRFVIQAFDSFNSSLIELLLTMFHFNVQTQKKFEPLAKLIGLYPSIMNNALHILSEDESIKDLVSLLALFWFPICYQNQPSPNQNQQQRPNMPTNPNQLQQRPNIPPNPNQQHPQRPNMSTNQLEAWVQLFLPAIESPAEVAIPTLFRLTSNNFSQFTSKLEESTRKKFVSSLFQTLYNTAKEPELKKLLGKIPDIACHLALDRIEPKKEKNTGVLINGFQFDLEIIFQAIKRIKEPTESQINTLFECYCQYMAKLTFFDAIQDKLLNEISKFIHTKSPDLFDVLITQFLPPTRYVALFLHQKYCNSIGKFTIDNPNELVQHLVSLCFSRSTALIAIDIILQFIDYVDDNEIILQINSAALHASYFHEEKAFTLISEYILKRDFSNNQKMQMFLSQNYKTALNDYRSPVRKNAKKALEICEGIFKYGIFMTNLRPGIFKNYQTILRNQRLFVFNFLFSKPFNDVPDPFDMINKCIDFLKIRTVPRFSKEFQAMIKKLKSINDIHVISFLDTKFIIKSLAMALPVCENLTKETWKYLISILKKEDMKQFVPMFIKNIRKEMNMLNKSVITSLPNNIPELFELLGQSSENQTEDILFVDFFIEFSPFLQQIQHLKQMNMQIQSQMQGQIHSQMQLQQMNQHMQGQIYQFVNWVLLQFRIPTNSPYNIQSTEKRLEALAKLVQNLKRSFKNNELDISMIFQALIKFSITCRKELISINTSYEYYLDAWPNDFFKVLVGYFDYLSQNEMDKYVLYLIVLEMVENPKCQQFRFLVFDNIIHNFKSLYEKVTKNSYLEIIFVRALDTLCRIVNELDYEQFDLYQVIYLTRKIINKLKKKKIDCFVAKNGDQPLFPSLFVKYVQILLPIRFAKQITENETLFSYYKTKIMTLFITRPSIQLFQHPVFNRRLVEFMKSIDDFHRNELYSLIPSPSTSQSILINQILCDRYKFFPQDARITINFSTLVKTPSFPVLLLNYSAVILATNRCVELTDLNNTPILTTNGYAQALAIDYKLRNLDSIKSLSRFFTILKVLTSIEADMPVGFENSLSQKLDTVPYMVKSGLMLYRYLGQTTSKIDHTKKAFTQFIINLSMQMISASQAMNDFENENKQNIDTEFRQNLTTLILLMPIAFRQLMDVKPACQRMFELMLQTVILVLTKMPSNLPLIQKYSTVLNEFINPVHNEEDEQFESEPKIDLNLINPELIIQIRDILSDKNDANDNQAKARFVLQFVPSIAKILFDPFIKDLDLTPFPRILLPSNFFIKNYPKEALPLYQKALEEMLKAGGYSVARKIIENMYNEYLKKLIKKISEPKSVSMFANVAKWFNDIDSPNLNKDQQQILDYLYLLLELFKPKNVTELIFDFSQLEQPLNRRVSHFISTLLETEFLTALNLVNKIDSIKPLSVRQSTIALQSDELTRDCMKIDWFNISPEYHIDLFMRLVCPPEFRYFIRYLTEKEKKQITTITLNSIPLPANFTSFMNYYIIHNPTSSLSECFSFGRRFYNEPPLPGLSTYDNIVHMESCNLIEDALGLLKERHRNFLNACDFEMLSQFRASQYYYLQTMQKDQSNYFLALNELRSLSINISLHSIPQLRNKILGHKKESTYPEITLPFFQDTFSDVMQSNSHFKKLTSSVSKSHIPLLIHAAMDIEIFQYIKLMQQPESFKTDRMDELIIISNTAWVPTLDRNMMMTSNFLWRLTILNDFLSNPELAQDNQISNHIKKLIKNNQNMIAVLLSKSGCTRDALKQFKKANDPKCISINKQNFLRIEQYLETDSTKLNKIKSEMNLYSKSHPIPAITSPVPAPLLSASESAMFNAYPMDSLKNRYLIFMKDYATIHVSGKKWLDILFEMFKGPYSKLIDPRQTVIRILREMQNSIAAGMQNSSKVGIPLYISMLIFMIKKSPDLIALLGSEYKTWNVNMRTTLIKWLPQLISTCPNVPVDFLHSLITANACHFYITFHDYYYSLKLRLTNFDITEKEINFLLNSNPNIKMIRSFFDPNANYLRTNKMGKEQFYITEYLNGISFLSKCEEDIYRYNHTVKVHKLLYELLSAKNSNLISQKLSNAHFSSLDELATYCEANQPIFTTDVKLTNYASFQGFKFQTMQMILNVSIESDGTNECELRFVNAKGEAKSLFLISPLLYQINQKERMIIEMIGHYIDKNIASGIRSHSTYYPNAFLIYDSLMAVDSLPFTSLHSAIQSSTYPFTPLRRIYEAATNFTQNADSSRLITDEDSLSPYASSLKKKAEIPSSSLFWWFFQGSSGFKTDFIFMRSNFASYYSVFSYIHFLFNNPIPPIPSLLLCKDRRRLFMPGFLNSYLPACRYIIQTPLIKGLLPDFVMRGSFSAGWHITANSIYLNRERLHLLLSALVLEPDLPSKQQVHDFCHHEQQDEQKLGTIVQSFQDQQKLIWKKISKIFFGNLRNDKTASIHMTEETEKTDDVFPFMLLDHMIESSQNALIAQPLGFAWI